VKKLKSLVFLSAFCALCPSVPVFSAPAENSKVLTPYFNMSLSEMVNFPSQGNLFTGGNMDADIGLLGTINETNSIFALYNFRYLGPSFYPQDTRQFYDRSLSHYMNLEYRLKLGEFRFRPGVAMTIGKRRTGSNEDWDTGLYNMNSQGAAMAVDWLYELGGKSGVITAKYLFRAVEFPNYTDLLREFQQAGSASELSGGLQNQNFGQFTLRSNWNNFTAGISYAKMNYLNQTVIDNTGVYGDTRQKDTDVDFDFGFSAKWWILEFYPNVEYSLYRSNQNFLRYKYFGAPVGNLTDPTAPVTFVNDDYSYNQLALRVPIDINLGVDANWAVSGAVELIRKNYLSRPPRDSDNNYRLGSTQNDFLTRFTVGLRKHLNEVADMRFSYTFTVAESNNHFEMYMPYNYTGHTLGLAYNIRY